MSCHVCLDTGYDDDDGLAVPCPHCRKEINVDVPDIIDEIYDRIERRFIGDAEEIKEWLRTPQGSLGGKSPNDMFKAGQAQELLNHVRGWELC